MNIKSKLRTILGNLLVKSQDRLTNKIAVKSISLDPDCIVDSNLNTHQLGGFVRILAADENNAKQILQHLTDRKDDELPIIAAYITDKALEYHVKPKQIPVYSHSVVIKLSPNVMLNSALKSCQNEMLRNEVLGHGHDSERIVIDFSSPNIAKPFHFGHLKSTILGNYLANINKFLGNQVTRLNYIGDWGTQYGLLSLGLEQFGNAIEESGSPLRKLLDVYVKANEHAKTDNAFYERAKQRFLLLDQSNDPEQLARWRSIRDLSLTELKRSYERLGVEFDVFEFESDYANVSTNTFDRLQSKNLIKRSEDGMLSVMVEKNNRTMSIPIRRSDGASLYITRDVAAAISRKERFNFDKMLYIVGADQEKHFHCLSEIVRNSDYDWYHQLIHVKMGKVLGMSSRSGNFELLSDIIDEASAKFVESTRDTPTTKVNDEDEIEDVGLNLALSALYLFDMRNARTRNYEFDWDKVMLRSSRSGINLQTTHARLSSLLRRAAWSDLQPYDCTTKLLPDAVCCLEGIDLMTVLCELDTELHNSYWTMDPSHLVNHAFRLCKSINKARQSERLWVVGENDERVARSRLSLFKYAQVQLELIIRLLGLKPLHKV